MLLKISNLKANYVYLYYVSTLLILYFSCAYIVKIIYRLPIYISTSLAIIITTCFKVHTNEKIFIIFIDNN